MFDFPDHPQKASPGKIVQILLVTAGFNTAIAAMLVFVGFGKPFWQTLLFSQSIGLTICTCVVIALHIIKTSAVWVRAAVLGFVILAGAILGTGIGTVLLRLSGDAFSATRGFLVQIVVISVIFGITITYFFFAREQLAASGQLIQEERIKRLSGEKQVLESDLKRLQAQIEPHFLFNTLSNVVGLMDADSAKAKSMLLDLIHYLRTTLGRTRDSTGTLGEEAELIKAYLNIFKIRMGDRLGFTIDIADALREHPLAPMLLQPIVENAVLHGIEPKIEGGEILVRAAVHARRLVIDISDSGVGFAQNAQAGVGLANVQERLAGLFGGDGRLLVKENQPSGVTVTIEVPLEEFDSKEKHNEERNESA
ncbi:MAG: sensor histidine kinase [Desulfobacteraceae bacterium]|nr:MAG: sensor histidine kinase [Desulfobacteraceae bacterium]